MGDEIYDLKNEDMTVQEDRGDRIDIKEVLERRIIIYKYDIRDSQYHNGQYAMIDIDVEGDGLIDHKRLLMTSSKVLISQLSKYGDKMPYRTVISKKKGDKWTYYTMGINNQN